MKLNATLLSTVLCMVACSCPSLADEAGARGVFFEQMKKPQEKLNTGVSYWVELQREGKTSKVTNKMAFVDKDKVRFHFTPNFDGYAYILMIEGSKGEKTVLFPSADAPVNKVTAGTEIVLPYSKGKEAWLQFDDNPGTETVRIIVSRDPIDVKEQLSAAKPAPADVVMTSSGAQGDKVPNGTLVSQSADGKPEPGSRSLSLKVSDAAPAGEVTVVRKDASKQLAIDIALEHKKHQ